MLRAAIRLGPRLRAPRLTRFASQLAPPSQLDSDAAWLHSVQGTDLSGHSLIEPLAFADDVPLTIVKAVEPSLSSLGLANFTPPGLLQSCLEFFHVTADLPWWGAIVAGTVCVRILIFPLVIVTRRNAATLHNNMPEMMNIQLKMTQARISNNREEATKYAMELSTFMREKGANPFKNMLAPLAQAPFFISFFMGLRGMCECPVESLQHGGMLWFENLILPDPIYMLPFLTSATMYVVLEIGADSGKLPETMKNFKWIFRIIPIVTFPITCQFPAALLCYWVTTNFISLIQVAILKVPNVRKYFNIPEMVNHPPGSIPKMPTPFNMTANDSWNNIKLTKQMEERNMIEKLLKEREEKRRKRRTSRRTKPEE